MAKRANPYVEDFIPQSKMHVGVKQFNNNDYRLQKVYQKTLDLLFKGAKKILPPNISNDPEESKQKKDKMKQLFIGKNGALQHSGCLVASKIASMECKCGMHVDGQCAYCDRVLCNTCQHTCSLCDKSYCSHCTLLGSEGLEVCVSCYQ